MHAAGAHGTFKDLDLSGIKLDRADLQNVRLLEVKLDGGSFKGANLQDAVLEESSALCLDGANLQGVFVSRLKHCSAKKSQGAAMKIRAAEECDFDGANLEEAQIGQLHQCSFRNANCRGLRVGHWRFQRPMTQAAQSDFTGADLSLASLKQLNLSGSQFVRAKLVQADLRQANLNGVDLTKADLRKAQLAGADLTNANVNGADFEGANLYGVKLDGVDSTKAKGLDPEKTKGGTVGPNLRQLDQVAKKAGNLKLRADVAIDDGHVELEVSGTHRYNTIQWTKHSADESRQADYDFSWQSRTFGQAMMELCQLWGGGTLRVDSIKTSSSKSPVKGADLKKLAVAAWCEALGAELPSEEDVAKQKKTRHSDQKKARQNLLEELLGTGGVKKWNARTPGEIAQAGSFRKVDFSEAKLSGVQFLGLDLQSANFSQASLSRSHFSDCRCHQASFHGANLQGANLSGSGFNGADFWGANLSKARLIRSSLRKAKFSGAKLNGASLKNADITGADLSKADLTNAVLSGSSFDGDTKFPKDLKLPQDMDWRGTGPNPAMLQAPKQQVGSISIEEFMQRLSGSVDKSRLSKALNMLKADRFKLFVQVADDSLVGVVKSQTDPTLVYSCRLAADGAFACCTQNLNPCGGLRGALCKHLLVLVVGLANSGDVDAATVDNWIAASKAHKPLLDKDIMSETLLRYKGAEAGEIDWRPTETVPEDYYAF
jgi:uncharacterized protein YjbI with pentapeptide repeats